MPRQRTSARVIRSRARHRAAQLLIERHRKQFSVLLEQEQRVAEAEAEMLEKMGTSNGLVLLRPGSWAAGQDRTDRVDLNTCEQCKGHHAADHVCARCTARVGRTTRSSA